jgi:mannose/fructose/N-acetylgalactosamine-specific phosphotransferase system component IIB
MVVFIRIDDRLIHGQVVEGWVNFLKATSIFVADDAVAENALQRSIMEISMPHGITLFIGCIKEICERVKNIASSKDRAILLFSNPSAVVQALNMGLECGELNIGGMHYVPGKRKLIDVLAVDDRDLEALREITSKGVKVTVQAVPNQKPLPLEKLFKACQPKISEDSVKN